MNTEPKVPDLHDRENSSVNEEYKQHDIREHGLKACDNRVLRPLRMQPKALDHG